METTLVRPPEPGVEAVTTLPDEPKIDRRTWLRRALGGAAVGAVAAGGYGWASHRLEITRHRHRFAAGLGHPLRVAALSDLHLSGRPNDYLPLLEAIEAERPDLVVVVGDIVDHPDSLHALPIFAELKPPLGKFASLGNWDHSYRIDRTRLEQTLRVAGFRLLVNETAEVEGLQIAGLDDAYASIPDPSVAIRAASEGPTLALSHCPVVFDALTAGITREGEGNLLTLSGHTHGGQIAPLGVALYTPSGSGRYVAGWYRPPCAALYVMRGVGFSRIPLRIGSRPELTLLELA